MSHVGLLTCRSARCRPVAPAEYSYRSKEEHDRAGTGYYFEGEQPIEQPGVSCVLWAGRRGALRRTGLRGLS